MKAFEGHWKVTPLPQAPSARPVGSALPSATASPLPSPTAQSTGTPTATSPSPRTPSRRRHSHRTFREAPVSPGRRTDALAKALYSPRQRVEKAVASGGNPGGSSSFWARARAWRSGEKAQEQRVASQVEMRQRLQLAFSPPPFLAQYVYGISRQATLDLLMDFKREAYRLRHQLEDGKQVHLLFDDELGGESEWDFRVHNVYESEGHTSVTSNPHSRKRYTSRRGRQTHVFDEDGLWEEDMLTV